MSSLSESNLEPVHHARAIRSLWSSARGERLPHALLFSGRKGIGKFRAARWLAQGLLCNASLARASDPCGECGACRRFLSNNHMDVLVIDAQEREREQLIIGWFVTRSTRSQRDGSANSAVDDYLSADEFLSLRPADGGWRVIIVREAERMNEEAQNSILKMLEEPGDRVLWVLETSAPERLVVTVRSRCVAVPFEPLTSAECAQVLAACGLDGATALTHARWSGGSPGDALELAARSAVLMHALIGEVVAGRLEGWRAARACWELEGEFFGRTPTAKARDRVRTLLALATAMLADVQRAAAGLAPDSLAHGEWIRSAASEVARLGTVEIARKLEALLEARSDIDKNLDPQAVLERALSELEPVPSVHRRALPSVPAGDSRSTFPVVPHSTP